MNPELEKQLVSVLKGACLAALGVFGAELLQGLSTVDFGSNAAWVAMTISIIAQAVRKLAWPRVQTFLKR